MRVQANQFLEATYWPRNNPGATASIDNVPAEVESGGQASE